MRFTFDNNSNDSGENQEVDNNNNNNNDDDDDDDQNDGNRNLRNDFEYEHNRRNSRKRKIGRMFHCDPSSENYLENLHIRRLDKGGTVKRRKIKIAKFNKKKKKLDEKKDMKYFFRRERKRRYRRRKRNVFTAERISKHDFRPFPENFEENKTLWFNNSVYDRERNFEFMTSRNGVNDLYTIPNITDQQGNSVKIPFRDIKCLLPTRNRLGNSYLMEYTFSNVFWKAMVLLFETYAHDDLVECVDPVYVEKCMKGDLDGVQHYDFRNATRNVLIPMVHPDLFFYLLYTWEDDVWGVYDFQLGKVGQSFMKVSALQHEKFLNKILFKRKLKATRERVERAHAEANQESYTREAREKVEDYVCYQTQEKKDIPIFMLLQMYLLYFSEETTIEFEFPQKDWVLAEVSDNFREFLCTCIRTGYVPNKLVDNSTYIFEKPSSVRNDYVKDVDPRNFIRWMSLFGSPLRVKVLEEATTRKRKKVEYVVKKIENQSVTEKKEDENKEDENKEGENYLQSGIFVNPHGVKGCVKINEKIKLSDFFPNRELLQGTQEESNSNNESYTYGLTGISTEKGMKTCMTSLLQILFSTRLMIDFSCFGNVRELSYAQMLIYQIFKRFEKGYAEAILSNQCIPLDTKLNGVLMRLSKMYGKEINYRPHVFLFKFIEHMFCEEFKSEEVRMITKECTICTKCQWIRKTENIESDTGFLLPLIVENREYDLNDLIRDSLITTNFETKCRVCKEETEHYVKRKITKFPDTLTIVINRFQNEKIYKSFVRYNEFLELDDIKDSDPPGGLPVMATYQLKAVMVLRGNNNLSGESICFVGSKGEYWRCNNDQVVPCHSKSDVFEQQAYLLVYEKDGSGSPLSFKVSTSTIVLDSDSDSDSDEDEDEYKYKGEEEDDENDSRQSKRGSKSTNDRLSREENGQKSHGTQHKFHHGFEVLDKATFYRNSSVKFDIDSVYITGNKASDIMKVLAGEFNVQMWSMLSRSRIKKSSRLKHLIRYVNDDGTEISRKSIRLHEYYNIYICRVLLNNVEFHLQLYDLRHELVRRATYFTEESCSLLTLCLNIALRKIKEENFRNRLSRCEELIRNVEKFTYESKRNKEMFDLSDYSISGEDFTTLMEELEKTMQNLSLNDIEEYYSSTNMSREDLLKKKKYARELYLSSYWTLESAGIKSFNPVKTVWRGNESINEELKKRRNIELYTQEPNVYNDIFEMQVTECPEQLIFEFYNEYVDKMTKGCYENMKRYVSSEKYEKNNSSTIYFDIGSDIYSMEEGKSFFFRKKTSFEEIRKTMRESKHSTGNGESYVLNENEEGDESGEEDELQDVKSNIHVLRDRDESMNYREVSSDESSTSSSESKDLYYPVRNRRESNVDINISEGTVYDFEDNEDIELVRAYKKDLMRRKSVSDMCESVERWLNKIQLDLYNQCSLCVEYGDSHTGGIKNVRELCLKRIDIVLSELESSFKVISAKEKLIVGEQHYVSDLRTMTEQRRLKTSYKKLKGLSSHTMNVLLPEDKRTLPVEESLNKLRKMMAVLKEMKSWLSTFCSNKTRFTSRAEYFVKYEFGRNPRIRFTDYHRCLERFDTKEYLDFYSSTVSGKLRVMETIFSENFTEEELKFKLKEVSTEAKLTVLESSEAIENLYCSKSMSSRKTWKYMMREMREEGLLVVPDKYLVELSESDQLAVGSKFGISSEVFQNYRNDFGFLYEKFNRKETLREEEKDSYAKLRKNLLLSNSKDAGEMYRAMVDNVLFSFHSHGDLGKMINMLRR